MKIAVTGALGQLGSDVCRQFEEDNHNVLKLDLPEVDISNKDLIITTIKELKPDIIVNTAAYHQPEHCEKNPAKAYEVNAMGALYLALAAEETKARLIHISTDYVFDGKQRSPYIEQDEAYPLNVYGSTKLAGEKFIQAFSTRYLILRTSGLYGHHPCRMKGGLNFVELMKKLAHERDEVRVVDHEVLTPTPTAELAKQIKRVAFEDLTGLAHATCEGECSWYRFAKSIFEQLHIKTPLHIARPDEFPEKVPRPHYSVLENRLLKNYGLSVLPDWEEGLINYLKSGQDI